MAALTIARAAARTIEEQLPLVNFLKTPAAYPHDVSNVIHVETHISHLFLTGTFAYKLKKPIAYKFLSFIEPKDRALYCQREVELNSRYAPDLYLEVVTICGSPERPKLDGDGPALEFLVKMRQFPSGSLFSELLAAGKLTKELLDELTASIVDFHERAEPAPTYWSPSDILSAVDENFTTCQKSPALANQSLLQETHNLALSTLERYHDLITARQKSHVRKLHGDLHLGNICLFQGRPTMFDGIEFNDALAACDVWTDLAFLVMDLQSKGADKLAGDVVNRYVELTDDYAGLQLLPFYIAYRAMVRAKVDCLTCQTAEDVNPSELACEASHYVELAHSALSARRPALIAIGGLSGSGKSTLGRSLASSLGAVHVRSDAVRKHLAGLSLLDRGDQSLYTPEMSKAVYQAVLDRAAFAEEAGLPTVVDATFLRPEQREACESWAAKRKIPFFGLWCHVPNDIAVARLDKRTGDVSDAGVAVYQRQTSQETGTITWHKLRTDRPVEELCRAASSIIAL